ncbi:MAG: outer-membrane lipoprotein carrier protein LolA [Gemmatimonadota bacterium]
MGSRWRRMRTASLRAATRRTRLGGVCLFGLVMAVGFGGCGDAPKVSREAARPGTGTGAVAAGRASAGREEFGTDSIPAPAGGVEARPTVVRGSAAGTVVNSPAREAAPARRTGVESPDSARVAGRENSRATGETGGAEAPGEARAERPGSARASEPPVDVDRLLRLADSAYRSLPSLRARFEQTVDVPLLERHRRGIGIWYQRGRGHFKMEFEDPPNDVIVADGTSLWLYYPSTNPGQVIRSDLTAPRTEAGTADVLAGILAAARTRYTGRWTGREEVKGTLTDVVRLEPKERSPYRLVRVWIAVRDHLVRKFEIRQENETVRTVTLWNLEPRAAISDSIFRFVPPEGTEVFGG